MKKVTKSAKFIGRSLMALSIVAAFPLMASAHCDTMEGPTVSDAKKALESNNVNYALKWVQPENEKAITQVFEQAMKAEKVSPEAKDLADKKFFEELVKVHRAGEGAPFTGVKPVGTPVNEKVAAADKSIEVGNLSPLEGMVPAEEMPELKERFEKAMALKNFDVNNVDAGREYIEAYVSFFKFAEGEEEGHAAQGEAQESQHAAHIAAKENKEISNPKTADMGTTPFAATSAITGLAALALGLKRKFQ